MRGAADRWVTQGGALGYGDKSCYYKPGNKEHRPVRECSMEIRSFCKHNQAGLERQRAVTLKAEELVQ